MSEKKRIKEFYEEEAKSENKILETMANGKFIKVTSPNESILLEPNLFEIITETEFDKKITGEFQSRKAIFLSLCSVWVADMEVPLNTLVSSESSSGKSYVCKKIIQIFPNEMVEYRSKISGEAFTYWHANDSEWTWDGKICYLEDISQGVLDSATFKVMCSEGSLATVVKNQKAIDLWVNGKPSMLVTTATTNPSTEVLNRFNITSLDESAKQTHDITLNQALDNKTQSYNPKIKDAFKLLNRLGVIVPFAPMIHNFITQNYSWNDVRMRRDFSRLMALIKCSAVLYQKQRKQKILPGEGTSIKYGKIIAEERDYEIARGCINYIQTTTLKGLTHKLKKAYESCILLKEFTAKDIHSKYPIASQKMWYNYLDELCERGLLTTELKDNLVTLKDGTQRSGKKVVHYKVPKKSSFNLPNYKELLDYVTIDSSDSFNTINTIDSKEGINCNNCINLHVKRGQEYEKIDFSELNLDGATK